MPTRFSAGFSTSAIFRNVSLPVTMTSALASMPATAQSPPFAFEDVDFTPECEPNEAFGRLLVLILGPASENGSGAAFDEALFNAVSGDTYHVLRLDRPASWHGLRLVEVRLQFGIERGPANYALAFADDPERVRSVWNARGWNLPRAGEVREIDDEVITTSVGIATDGVLATVTCSSD